MTEQSVSEESRWSFVRDILVFQVKLLADGIRDMLLIPASLIAGLAGLLFYRNNPAEPFHTVLGFGKRSEHWIDLFGSLPRRQQLEASISASRVGNLDRVVDKLEGMLLEQYEKGGITARAKNSIDKTLDALHRGIDKVGPSPTDDEDQ